MKMQFDFSQNGEVFNSVLLDVENPAELFSSTETAATLIEDALFDGKTILSEDPKHIAEHLMYLMENPEVQRYDIDISAADVVINNSTVSFIYNIQVEAADEYESCQVFVTASIPTIEATMKKLLQKNVVGA